MSFSPAILAFQFESFDQPRRRAPRGGRPPAQSAARPDHPVLFLGGFLFTVSLAVIGLWQALGLLLPH
jgi:hypothetical protein